MTELDNYEDFGINTDNIKGGITLKGKGALPSEFIEKKIISDPKIMEQMSVYVSMFGRKPHRNPIILASQVADIDEKLRNSYKAIARSNYNGAEEHFENYTSSSGYKYDEQNFVSETEKQKGVDVQGFEGESFEGFLPLLALTGDKRVQQGGLKIIKHIGGKLKKKIKSKAKASQAVANNQADARLSNAKADAISSGVSAEQVNSIVNNSANETRGINKRNLEILDTVVKKTVPAKILEKMKGVIDEYKAQETAKELGKQMPILVGVLIGAIVLTIIVMKVSK